MSRELWERVRSDEVRVGDVVSAFPIRYEMEVKKEILDTWQFDDEDDFIYRRIPDADDPRVLRRALEIAHGEIESINGNKYFPRDTDSIESYIDQAIRELKIERSDD